MSDPISVNGEADAFIKNELSKFVFKHTGQDALSSIDEIVLSYVVSILESLGSADSPEEAFDVDEFVEMMSAYITSFSNINSSDICEWMFHLAEWLRKTNEKNGERKSFEETFSCLSRLMSPNSTSCDNGAFSSSFSSSASSSRSRSTSQSEDDERSINHIAKAAPCSNKEIEVLTEMFPHLSVMDIQQCFTTASGDCERAVQLLLQRQDSNQQLNGAILTSAIRHKPKGSSENILGDKKLREMILNRYGYIDQDDDVREHKPVAPKAEPKKLIRYRDSKIVSLKGERFSEIKTEQDEAQKKTFVSLKPARQYRFH